MTSILEYCVRIVRPKFKSNPKKLDFRGYRQLLMILEK